ncbi:MAG: hypothetical protein Q7S28_01480 [bacterium]|nr:hypothetical protein [bacterium]
MKKYTVISLALALFVPISVFAAMPLPPGGVTAPLPIVTAPGDVDLFLTTAIDWVFYFLMILAVAFILFAAYVYLTSGGEPDRVKKANHMLLYAAIAVAVGILATTIPFLVMTILS